MVPENVCSATLPTFKGMTTEFSFMLLRLTRGRRQRTPGLYHVTFPGADFAYLVNHGIALISSCAQLNSWVCRHWPHCGIYHHPPQLYFTIILYFYISVTTSARNSFTAELVPVCDGLKKGARFTWLYRLLH